MEEHIRINSKLTDDDYTEYINTKNNANNVHL